MRELLAYYCFSSFKILMKKFPGNLVIFVSMEWKMESFSEKCDLRIIKKNVFQWNYSVKINRNILNSTHMSKTIL